MEEGRQVSECAGADQTSEHRGAGGQGATRRRRRKRLPRKAKWRGRKGQRSPETRALIKAKWQDPEYRERQRASRAAAQAKWQGIGRRLDVPEGYRKEEAAPLNEQAKESAKQTMAELEAAGVLVEDNDAAKEALQSAIEVMRKPGSKQVQLAAAKLVLEYTKSKPVAKQHVTVNAAEEWLKAVANDSADEGATQDA